MDTFIPAIVTDILEDSFYVFLTDTLDALHLVQIRDDTAIQLCNGYFSRWGFHLDTNVEVRDQIWAACYDMADRMLTARELDPVEIQGTRFPDH